jgi:hypothetical protein
LPGKNEEVHKKKFRQNSRFWAEIRMRVKEATATLTCSKARFEIIDSTLAFFGVSGASIKYILKHLISV